MSGANSTIRVPNPYAQIAWVAPPDNARNLVVKLYAVVGALAVLIWDILLHLSQDYKILKNYKINFMTIVYVISRVASLAYILGLAIVTTAPVGNCNLIRYIDFIYPFSLPFSILHFVPRVAALHRNNRFVLAFFTCTWLGVLATAILWPFGVVGLKLGPTNYCVEIKYHPTASIATLCLVIHDSLIFVATCWAFRSHPIAEDSVKGMLKTMVLGQNLPRFTRSILRDGQAYYLASLVIRLMFLSQYYVQSPFVFPCSFGNPSFVLTTNMAAYVYRNIRLGYFRDYTMTTSILDKAIERSNQSDRPQGLSIVFKKSSATESELSNSARGHHERTIDLAEPDSGGAEKI